MPKLTVSFQSGSAITNGFFNENPSTCIEDCGMIKGVAVIFLENVFGGRSGHLKLSSVNVVVRRPQWLWVEICESVVLVV